ncbi:hypothetical protein ACWEP2_02775, partial [Streptomyces sp. NPDC004279]
MLEDVARKIADAIWETPGTPAVDKNPAGTTKSEDNVEGPHREVGPFDVLPGESNGGGYEIRTREGLPPTRFPSVLAQGTALYGDI